MNNLDLLGSAISVIVILLFCIFGMIITGLAVVGVNWGLRRGKARVTTNERNFDDFGR